MQTFYGVSHLCVLVSVELAKGEQQEQDGPQLIRKAERETAGCLPHFLSHSLSLFSLFLALFCKNNSNNNKKKKNRHLHIRTWLQQGAFSFVNASLTPFMGAFAHILPKLDKVLGIMAITVLISELCLQGSVSGRCIYRLHIPSSLEEATNMEEWIVELWADLSRKQNNGHQWALATCYQSWVKHIEGMLL